MCKSLTPLDTTIKKCKDYIAANEANDPMYDLLFGTHKTHAICAQSPNADCPPFPLCGSSCAGSRFSSGQGPPLDLTSLLPAAGAAGGTPPEAKIFGAFYVIFTGVLHALLEHLVTSLVR